ncbi:MAG: DNA polymerase III subunit gamma/tau [Defluviitaleaceae bacterium]|nr:DNA polymerase III subunit gamma/tau [Defluviitaleaceae bacterium]
MHTALYRKKRPKTFADLVGQPHVVRALSNQLETGQLSHSYLFCGTRGTGKTSAARIFARAVNCLAPLEGNPCNACENCQNILSDRSLDVIEIDAASNNSVDNIRDLREEVRYTPTQCKYKVYIIDEVHMLSTSAFNALLKTLEEPPAHVIFILATTDPQKIPATILSRCQRYDFKRITATDMVATMGRYLEAENTEYEETALEQIAYHSDGAMRDALSLLDQCLAIGTGGATLANVLSILGAVDRSVLFEFTNAIGGYDSGKALEIIDGAMTEGRDVAQFTSDLVRHFRDVLVASQGAELDLSEQIKEKLRKQGSEVSADRLIRFIQAFSETLRELKFVPHMRTALEVCSLKLCSPGVATDGSTGQVSSDELEGLISRIAKLEKRIAEIGAAPIPVYAERAPVAEQNTKAPITADESALPSSPAITASSSGSGGLSSQLLEEIKASWRNLCNGLPPMVRSMLIRCELEVDGGTLNIVCDNESEAKILKDKNRPLLIREALAERFNLSTPPNLAFIVRETYNERVVKKPLQFTASAQPIVEAPPTPKPDPVQMGWDDYTQEVDSNETPFH